MCNDDVLRVLIEKFLLIMSSHYLLFFFTNEGRCELISNRLIFFSNYFLPHATKGIQTETYKEIDKKKSFLFIRFQLIYLIAFSSFRHVFGCISVWNGCEWELIYAKLVVLKQKDVCWWNFNQLWGCYIWIYDQFHFNLTSSYFVHVSFHHCWFITHLIFFYNIFYFGISFVFVYSLFIFYFT